MGRELRQRKPVTYNESVLSLEAAKAASSAEEIANQRSLLKFTRTGINNTSKSKISALEAASLRQYSRNRSRDKPAAGTEPQRHRHGSSSSLQSDESEGEHSIASEESDDAVDDSDADDFQQTKPRSKKSAYDIDMSDSEQESDSDSPGSKRKGTRQASRGKASKSDAALQARRQPRRKAAVKVSLAESLNESSEADSQQSAAAEEKASDDDQEDSRNKKRIGRDCKADKAGVKRQKALAAEDDSDDSMAEPHAAVVISDSEAQADEESDKENQPTKQTRRTKKPVKPVQAKQKSAKAKASNTSNPQAKAGQKKPAAASRKRQPVVLSDSAESEEEEKQDSSSEDETERLEIERVLDGRLDANSKQEEFLVKFKERSFRKAKWLPQARILELKPQLLRNFIQRRHDGSNDEFGDLVHGIHPDSLLVERVIAQKSTLHGQLFLTKWRSLAYSESTWEVEEDLKDDKNHLDAFKQREKAPPIKHPKSAPLDKLPQFLNGRTLRDYQEVSLKWMVNNWGKNVNCILGDEMGLGKTAQSISTLEFQRQLCDIPGPFLIVAPLTTLGHWQREVETWTSMNVVLYNGSAADREMIREHEFHYKTANWSKGKPARYASGQLKFNVLLASYEMVRKDRKVFQDIAWETVIIDEAHRLKNTTSDTRAAVAGMPIQWLLLLTGTPVQNNMRELFGLMNLLDNEKYANEDDFFESFGGDKEAITLPQVQALQEELRPILLRRMKEDVENLPEKEEVVVWVQLTHQQRTYYKALYSNQIGALLSGCSAKNLPNLRNLAMELRKVCCHPFLCNGLEEDFAVKKHAAGNAGSELELLVQSSGKMLLLHKLLPKLKAEGHKVLIFSQFKIMMDVLEDSFRLRQYPVERIDGSVSSRDRQAAIDRYSKGDADSFIFLLSTRAGGQGITLTAADTVIIYDSDWNPQNDLQAMARCHRIGQSKEVTIYRLVCKDTYEQQVFECSSRKYGLDEAILGSMNSCGDPEQDGKKIADLLKYGAHSLVGKEDDAKQEEEAFAAENIDQILAGRTEKRQIGSRKGNTFSTATFSSNEMAAAGKNDREYWAQLMPDAVNDHDQLVEAAKAPQVLAPRRRKAVNYNESKLHRKYVTDSESEATAAEARSDPDNSAAEDGAETKAKGKKAAVPEESVPKWTKADVRAVEDRLLALGQHRTAEVRELAGVARSRSLEEVAELEQALCFLIKRSADIADAKAAKLHAQLHSATITDPSRAEPGPRDTSQPHRGHAEDTEADKLKSGRNHAEHAEGDSTKSESKELGVSEPSISASSELIDPEVEKLLPKSAHRALTSTEVQLRLRKQGQRFHKHLTERSALHELITAVQAGDAHAKLRLYALTKMPGQPWREAAWWAPKDDKALLQGYYKHGGIFWAHKAITAAMDSILSDQSLDFTVKLIQKPPSPEPDSAAQLGGTDSSAQVGGTDSAAQLGGTDSSAHVAGTDSSAQLGGTDSSGMLLAKAAPAAPMAESHELADPRDNNTAAAMDDVQGDESHGEDGISAASAGQKVCQLNEVKWRSLSMAVMQRLKRLLTGVSDPEAFKHEYAAREERKALAARHKAEAKRQRKLERQRQRHEEAARYCSQQQETAAQQLNLHPSAQKAAPVQDVGAKGVLLSKAFPDAIRDVVTEVAKGSSATDQHRSSSVQDAPKQQRPQGCELAQGPAGSRDHIMLDVAAEDGGAAAEQAEAGFAAAPTKGQIGAMNHYMPVMPAVTADKPGATESSAHLSQLNKRMRLHGKSAFKQTTLVFGKKPKTTANMSSTEVVDLCDI